MFVLFTVLYQTLTSARDLPTWAMAAPGKILFQISGGAHFVCCCCCIFCYLNPSKIGVFSSLVFFRIQYPTSVGLYNTLIGFNAV